MTGQPEHVVIVGAGLGGVRTAQQLRSAGLQGRISLVGAETHQPYDRPPLSKQVLTGEWGPERTTLAGPDSLDELGVRAHLGNPAVALHPGDGSHELKLADGAALHGDAVVIATGLVARSLPDQPAHVHTLRTLDDALALRETLEQAGSLLVVGAGFIGAEVASSARTRDIAVTVVEALDVPAAEALGPRLGALVGRLLADSGAELHTGVRITGFPDEVPEKVAVELADGRRIAADAAVVGIGGRPRLEWLAGTGLDTSHALACGSTGRVHGLERVWAVGDVAAWDDPVHGDRHCHEHWTSATDQAAIVARDVLAAPPPPATVPYFWSDQFGLKIQLLGRPELGEDVVPLHGTGLDGGPVRGTVAAYVAGDRVVAVAGFGAARLVARYRPLVAANAPVADAHSMAATLA